MKLVLYRGSFSNDYVARIRAEIPSEFRITETTLPEDYKSRGTNYLLRLFGSRQTQANQMIKISFYGTHNHNFMIYITELKQFLLQFVKQPSLKPAHASLVPALPTPRQELPPLPPSSASPSPPSSASPPTSPRPTLHVP